MSDYSKRMKLYPPASSDEIAKIPHVVKLPEDYLAFMRASNGAEGSIGKAYLAILSVDEMVQANEQLDVEERAPGLVLFASDGGAEMYCFDLRREQIRVSVINMMDIGFEEPRYRSDTFSGLLQFLESTDDPWLESTSGATRGH
jgi:hypothetical protein